MERAKEMRKWRNRKNKINGRKWRNRKNREKSRGIDGTEITGRTRETGGTGKTRVRGGIGEIGRTR